MFEKRQAKVEHCLKVARKQMHSFIVFGFLFSGFLGFKLLCSQVLQKHFEENQKKLLRKLQKHQIIN